MLQLPLYEHVSARREVEAWIKDTAHCIRMGKQYQARAILAAARVEVTSIRWVRTHDGKHVLVTLRTTQGTPRTFTSSDSYREWGRSRTTSAMARAFLYLAHGTLHLWHDAESEAEAEDYTPLERILETLHTRAVLDPDWMS